MHASRPAIPVCVSILHTLPIVLALHLKKPHENNILYFGTTIEEPSIVKQNWETSIKSQSAVWLPLPMHR